MKGLRNQLLKLGQSKNTRRTAVFTAVSTVLLLLVPEEWRDLLRSFLNM